MKNLLIRCRSLEQRGRVIRAIEGLGIVRSDSSDKESIINGIMYCGEKYILIDHKFLTWWVTNNLDGDDHRVEELP